MSPVDSPDSTVRETRCRVRAAVRNVGARPGALAASQRAAYALCRRLGGPGSTDLSPEGRQRAARRIRRLMPDRLL